MFCFAVDNGLIKSVSSEASDLLSPFNEQTAQLTSEDWYKEYRSASNLDETSFGGLLAPYFEVSEFTFLFSCPFLYPYYSVNTLVFPLPKINKITFSKLQI